MILYKIDPPLVTRPISIPLKPSKSCDALIQHIEVAHDHDVDSGVELPTSDSEHAAEVEESETYTAFNGGVENQYNQKLSADKLVSLIGKDETKKLIDYFYESLGNLNINSMVLIRHGLPTDMVTTILDGILITVKSLRLHSMMNTKGVDYFI